ncbi:MAG: response regulator transcription factor [Planctomycetota bacterium]|nr:response regulator transcription factor [Planctomycetaceae bacterium]MDQ3333115.1 response regulator transcription factor [Planctomycetota bacterium]
MSLSEGISRGAVLVVEDEPRLLRDLARGLRAERYAVYPAGSGEQARRLCATETIDAAILDRMLPDGDGLALLRDLRASNPKLPALVVTARDSVPDRVAGLDAGADDYLVKPFAFDELLARLRAVLRRARGSDHTTIRAGRLEIDLLRRCVHRDGATLELTPRQCELLAYLARQTGRPVGREELLREVWDEPPGTATNVVEVSVNHLRRKLTRRGWPDVIQTVRGEGYLLEGDS